jgi:hypothetical protein
MCSALSSSHHNPTATHIVAQIHTSGSPPLRAGPSPHSPHHRGGPCRGAGPSPRLRGGQDRSRPGRARARGIGRDNPRRRTPGHRPAPGLRRRRARAGPAARRTPHVGLPVGLALGEGVLLVVGLLEEPAKLRTLSPRRPQVGPPCRLRRRLAGTAPREGSRRVPCCRGEAASAGGHHLPTRRDGEERNGG